MRLNSKNNCIRQNDLVDIALICPFFSVKLPSLPQWLLLHELQHIERSEKQQSFPLPPPVSGFGVAPCHHTHKRNNLQHSADLAAGPLPCTFSRQRLSWGGALFCRFPPTVSQRWWWLVRTGPQKRTTHDLRQPTHPPCSRPLQRAPRKWLPHCGFARALSEAGAGADARGCDMPAHGPGRNGHAKITSRTPPSLFKSCNNLIWGSVRGIGLGCS